MDALRRWIRKVMSGVAAFLLVAWQSLGSIDLSHHMMLPFGGPYTYAWTHDGMRISIDEAEQIARTEEEVREERIRMTGTRERADEHEKAAS
ncbi:hypothetical protein CIG75_13695 [Tumebacillus algifaecis]|uniref:Uncharacterized protein n=1 Tax=Tumebacillus algifaecis TaxID=1214604 RepID=A0A223D3C6_9BACL|nr:hypothetical protein [Tumebacillus algifaecis]ASS75907.1 hypothetical protein CIG75_13695 [Tumebacillus algifaecis]